MVGKHTLSYFGSAALLPKNNISFSRELQP